MVFKKGNTIGIETRFKEGDIPWIKDKEHKEESKYKIKQILLGHNVSDKTKEKIRSSKYHANLKGENHPMYNKRHLNESKIKQSNSHKGKIVSRETRIKISKSHKGILFSNERKINISRSKLGKKYPKELYPKMGWRTSRKYQIFPTEDTSIEIKIQGFLRELGIEFYTHQFINIKYAYQCDILIPSSKIIIECDGDYWHGNLKKFNNSQLSNRIKCQRSLDFERNYQLEEKGYKVIRLWGSDIKVMDLNKFQEILQ